MLAGVLVEVVLAGPRVTGAEGHQQFKECVAYGNMKVAQQTIPGSNRRVRMVGANGEAEAITRSEDCF